MLCEHCGYPLWGIRQRQCPECGTAFAPSTYRFDANTVQFCCPHCDQQYFGTDTKGLPTPRAFVCTGCDQDIELDDMVLLPVPGHESDAWPVPLLPLTSRWFQLVKMALFSPSHVMQHFTRSQGIERPLLFTVITQYVYVVSGLFLPALFLLFSAMPTPGTMGWKLTIGEVIRFSVFSVICAIGITCFGPIASIMAHCLLRLTGPTRGDFVRTMQCFCLASGSTALIAIPVFSPFMAIGPAPIWWAFSTTKMIQQAQGVSLARAAIAVWVPVGMLAAGTVVFFLLV